MKSIKTNPNSAKGPDKGKIVNKLYCKLLTTKLVESSFLCRFRIESVNVFVLPRFDLCHVAQGSHYFEIRGRSDFSFRCWQTRGTTERSGESTGRSQNISLIVPLFTFAGHYRGISYVIMYLLCSKIYSVVV
jgi:hypothetical protein